MICNGRFVYVIETPVS